MSTFGFICTNRSDIPSIPKSGEQVDHMAPILVVASIKIKVSISLFKTEATTSFSLTPNFFRNFITFETS